MITINGKTFGRSLALVGDDEVSVEGSLDASAHGYTNGPGGGFTTSGLSNSINRGGGGAGGKTAGGHGGNATVDGGAQDGGAAIADPALLVGLVGGASAYRDLETDQSGEAYGGGGGGGAVTLIACRGPVSVSGMINAGGGGGRGGVLFLNMPLHAFAGGSGGYVVLQGASVTVTGGIFANGGAGGSGRRGDGTIGMTGADGTLSATMPATAGTAQGGQGAGGRGGIEGLPAGNGGHPTQPGGSAGGGGGSVGFLQIYTPRGVTPTINSTEISPAFQPHATIPLR